MDKTSELKSILGQYFVWNKARLDCFTRMLIALITVQTVNLKEIAIALVSRADVDSRYKRLRRFFSQFNLNYDFIARFIFNLFFSGKKVYLTIDRTNWFLGKAKINILMLGVAHEGVAIPLLWNLLPKAGNATADEHKAIIKRFISIFGAENIIGILADREFGSGKLFKFLNKNNVPFYIRIKEGSNVCIKSKKFSTPKKLFAHLNCKEKSEFHMTVWIFGEKIYLAGSRSERGELMIIATNQHPKNAIAIYLRRWEIEMLFCCLKGRGFRFEDTRLTKLDRIEKMVGVLAIAFSWAHCVGEWRAEKKPIRLSRHYDSTRPQNSLFRYGLDFIREIIINPLKKASDLKECLKVFQPLIPIKMAAGAAL